MIYPVDSAIQHLYKQGLVHNNLSSLGLTSSGNHSTITKKDAIIVYIKELQCSMGFSTVTEISLILYILSFSFRLKLNCFLI